MWVKVEDERGGDGKKYMGEHPAEVQAIGQETQYRHQLEQELSAVSRVLLSF